MKEANEDLHMAAGNHEGLRPLLPKPLEQPKMYASLPVASTSLSEEELRQRMDEGIPPESADEYLARVRLEASSLPEVFVADSKSNKSVDEGEIKEENVVGKDGRLRVGKQVIKGVAPPSSPSPAWVLPPEDWRQRFLTEFVTLKGYMNEMLEILPDLVEQGLIEIPLIPKRRNAIAWYQLCYGNQEAVPKAVIRQNNKKDEAKDATKNLTFSAVGQPPLLQLVLHIDYGTVEKLLKDHIAALKESGRLETHKALWLFALLSRIEKPLSGDLAADLTKLNRICTKIRDQFDEISAKSSRESLCVLNMIITICKDHFNQR